MINYHVIYEENSLEIFQQRVNEWISRGFNPLGPPIILQHNNYTGPVFVYHQAMVFEEDTDEQT